MARPTSSWIAVACLLPCLTAAGEPPSRPGCDIEARMAPCLEEAGNGYELLACYKPALADAERALAAQLERLRSDNSADRPGLVAEIEASHAAWLAASDTACDAVAAEWDGGSLQRAQVVACRLQQVLDRSRWLWQWHEVVGAGEERCDET